MLICYTGGMVNEISKENSVLDTDEQVIVVVRQGMVGIVPKLILPGLLVIAPFFFLFLLFSRGMTGVVFFFSMLGMGVVLIARRVYLWQQQVMIITTQHIIDIDQRGLFKRIVSSASLSHMVDAYYETVGIWQTLARAGNVIVVLNDGKTKFEFKNVSHPEHVLRVLNDAHKKYSM